MKFEFSFYLIVTLIGQSHKKHNFFKLFFEPPIRYLKIE